jgi:hypothetical membrane protein
MRSFMQLQNCFNEGMVRFWCVSLHFLFMKMNLVVCGFCRTIRACGCLLLLFMRLFWLFLFSCRTLKWVHKYWSARGMSGHESARPIKGMCEGC